MDQINLDNNLNKINSLIAQVEQVIKGKRHQVEMIVTCLLAQGHILIEDNPGSGKTVTARALAAAISGEEDGQAIFKRIQFTPDLLPMDLIGAHIYDEENKDFLFKKGPLFTNILLADEINRASPKVQSALLESMAERQITVAEKTYILDDLFFVMATQNPIEMEGTYPLPSAQLDRFFMKIIFGYVDEATELSILNNYNDISKNLLNLDRVVSKEEILEMQQFSNQIDIHPELVRAVSNIVRNSRVHPDITVGASTRSGIAFIKCLKAFAMVKGRNFVIDNDVNELAHSILHHRLVFRNRNGQAEALQQIINEEVNRLAKLRLFQ